MPEANIAPNDRPPHIEQSLRFLAILPRVFPPRATWPRSLRISQCAAKGEVDARSAEFGMLAILQGRDAVVGQA